MPSLPNTDEPTCSAVVPVVLFAYARPLHLERVLACLRENRVPLILAFADGAKGEADAARVEETRALLRAVDWCELRLVEREANLGLGPNVLAGVTQAAGSHDAFIVWEDDLVCVPGTYDWMCAALKRYAGDERVMSVSAWTHPRVTPEDVGESPYFDRRADCWVWGAWARSWRGMNDLTALEKMRAASRRGIAPDDCGADLPEQAAYEKRRKVWAVRWLYHHLQHEGLCLRPPWSMVEHIGFDASATNAAGSEAWQNPPLRPAPPVPAEWPVPNEHPLCRELWRAANPRPGASARARRLLVEAAKRVLPRPLRARLRSGFGPPLFQGRFPTWAEARAASGGYDDGAILRKVLGAALEVQAGRAAFERDGVLFHLPEPDLPLKAALGEIAGGGLRVLDFGGSLGSVYWRNRDWLPAGDRLRWDVVEQPGFVAAGRRHLTDPRLRFFENVAEAERDGGHDLLLCSCALQYLEEPFRFLEEWGRLAIPHVLLNNLPLIARGRDHVRVQRVPPSIYPASYPVWFFNRADFLRRVGERFEIMKEFEAEAVWPVGFGMFQSTGLLLKRRARG